LRFTTVGVSGRSAINKSTRGVPLFPRLNRLNSQLRRILYVSFRDLRFLAMIGIALALPISFQYCLAVNEISYGSLVVLGHGDHVFNFGGASALERLNGGMANQPPFVCEKGIDGFKSRSLGFETCARAPSNIASTYSFFSFFFVCATRIAAHSDAGNFSPNSPKIKIRGSP